ncbi:MAG: hypothetical protein AB7I50_19465 [Vicinamibacterales bacterium]
MTRDDLVQAHALLERARQRAELLTAAGLALMHGGEALVADDGPLDVVVLGDALHETAPEITGALGEASTLLGV